METELVFYISTDSLCVNRRSVDPSETLCKNRLLEKLD